MKVFHCHHCGGLLFFENTQCVTCSHRVAYLPDLGVVGSLDADPDAFAVWRSPLAEAAPAGYRLCHNYKEHEVCNWAVASDDPSPLCRSCRLTRVVPDLTRDGARQAWYRLEAAKRRLVFTLLGAHIPLHDRNEDPQRGLAFEFKADLPTEEPVLTGHVNGVITVSIAEADDVEREKRRTALHEPYRTLLGHVRHESGHYYWERLVAGCRTDSFREIFGDERIDYQQALTAHYQEGAPANWQDRFVSAYASSHPWEDWAETWAHYLHMVDALEMAAACGVSVQPRRSDEPHLQVLPVAKESLPFDSLLDNWIALTYVLNNLNRSLGAPDAYPFVLSAPVVDKLRYIHKTVLEVRE